VYSVSSQQLAVAPDDLDSHPMFGIVDLSISLSLSPMVFTKSSALIKPGPSASTSYIAIMCRSWRQIFQKKLHFSIESID